MNETRFLIRLLQTYIPQNWEFVPAFSKLGTFGEGGVTPLPPKYASAEIGSWTEQISKIIS
jgi:hypothetical protein